MITLIAFFGALGLIVWVMPPLPPPDEHDEDWWAW